MPLDIELILKHKDNYSFHIQHSYKSRGGVYKWNLIYSCVVNFASFYLEFKRFVMHNNEE